MDFLDRVPTYPNRKKITYEDGSVEYITIEYADEPIEPGTPLNKATLETLQTVVGTYIGNSDKETVGSQFINLGFTPKAVIVASTSVVSSYWVNGYAPQMGLATKQQAFGREDGIGIEIVPGGFYVHNVYNSHDFYSFNYDGYAYTYVAFKDEIEVI